MARKRKVKFDAEGWAKFPPNRPRTFDLVIMSDGKEEQLGWWTGTIWSCGRRKVKGKIKKWKKLPRGFVYYE